MKKVRLSLFFFVFLMAFRGSICFAQTALELAELNGPVKRYENIDYSVDQDEKGRVTVEIYEKTIMEFDREGHVLSFEVYDKDGELEDHYETAISTNEGGGRQIEYFFEDNEGKRFRGATLVYDRRGNIVEELVYNEDGSLDTKAVRKTDESGNVIEETTCNIEEGDSETTRYRYDEMGNEIEWIGDDGDRGVTEYDDRGNRTTYSYYNMQGEREFQSLYRYDERRNMVEEITYARPDGSYSDRYVYRYDDAGRRIESRMYRHGEEDAWHIGQYSYDQKGRKIKDAFYRADGSLRLINTYIYDEWGNILESKSYYQSEDAEKPSLSDFETTKYDYWE